MRRQFIQYFILTFLISLSLLYAGETGKIAGRITDSKTGEALIGANVIVFAKWVNNTEQSLFNVLGAATDFEGEYFILNLPPGEYSVKASFVGYKQQVITRVQVNVDKTTSVDFKLVPDEFQTEEVTVTAFSQKTVEPDVTATKQVYNIRDVQSIAGVADIADILELQADVVDDHFRGGRVGESLYLMGGGSIVNPLNNQRAFRPIVTGLEQVEVYTSGFSAEYGNAQSGVVNMVAREGSNVWETRMELAAIPPHYKTWGGSPYRMSNLDYYNTLKELEAWLEENPTQPGRPLFDAGYGFGGVYLPERIQWPPNPLTVADSLHIAKLGQISWMQGFRDIGMEYDNNIDYRLDFTAGGPIANGVKLFAAGRQNVVSPKVPTPNDDVERQIMTNLTYQPDPDNKFKFRFVYDYQFENYLDGNWLRWLFERTFSVSKIKQNSLQYGFSWNHIINKSSFFDLTLNILDVYSERRVELLTDIEFLNLYSNGSNWVDYTAPSNQRVGRLADDRGTEQTFSYDFNGSYTSQVDKNNLIKAGLQFTFFDVDVQQEYNVVDQGSFRDVDFNAFPFEGAFYIQDKMEFGGFIANIGLRYDIYDFNVSYYADEFSPLRNPDYDESLPYLERGQYYDRDKAKKERTKLFTRLQPRVGLSFPLSETQVFHLNYGTFTQRPSFNQIFYSQVTLFNEIEVLGNPRLKPENTSAYDIGLVNAFPLGIKLDVSAYYKDVTNLVESAYFFDEQQSVYRTYKNRDYADIKGFHVSIEKNEGALRGYLRYNYESATGKSSNALDAPVSYFENPAEGQEAVDLPDPEDVYLDYDRSHKAVANIRYLTSSDFGFSLGNFYPLADISLSLTYKVYSGRPYTYDISGQGLKFNRRTPTENDMRMRIEKRLEFGNTLVTIYGEGFNLLNEKVFNYSRTFDDERTTQRWHDDRENILTYNEYYPYVTSQDIYLLSNQPRNFRFGVIVKF
ncbi:MAG: TonB-dependent receptor [Melioribacteraceae bacterium]|nr:TonB-dependent receptor [Melioribacteraceae bacterium]